MKMRNALSVIAFATSLSLNLPAVGATNPIAPTLVTDSIFHFMPSASDNYNFWTTNTGENNEYFLIQINTDKLSNAPGVHWSHAGTATQSFQYNDTSKTGSYIIYTPYSYNGNSIVSDNAYRYYTTLHYTNPYPTGSSPRNGNQNTDVINKYYFNQNSSIGPGAMSTGATLSTITADFIRNYSSHTNNAGALSVNGSAKIGTINGNFIQNTADSSNQSQGGAMRSTGQITTINANFINNTNNRGFGGAIYNTGKITTINGSFVSNVVERPNISSNYGKGGGIYNTGTINEINGSFVNNSARGNGGAISNYGTIKKIKADFAGNKSYGLEAGGAIFNNNLIENIEGDFVANYSKRSSEESEGGDGAAIKNNRGTILDIKSNFIGNYSVAFGGAISNIGNSKINSLTSNFVDNSATEGGGIRNNGRIGNLTGSFIDNDAYEREGGGIANNHAGIIDKIEADFIGNTANTNGGGIANAGTIYTLSGDFIKNTATGRGGAIYNSTTLQYPSAAAGTGTVNIYAASKDIRFVDNTDSTGSNAIHQSLLSTTRDNVVNLNAASGKTITINDAITGDKIATDSNYTNLININKTLSYQNIDDTTVNIGTGGNYKINNTISGNSISLNNGATLELGKNTNGSATTYGKLDLSNPNGYDKGFGITNDTNNGTLNIINDYIHGAGNEHNLGDVTLNSVLGLKLDVNATLKTADTLIVNGTSAGTINIEEINWVDGSQRFEGTIQILQNQNTADIIQLSLASSLTTPDVEVIHRDDTSVLTTNTINWNDDFGTTEWDDTVTWQLGLDSVDTTNDSIKMTKTTVSSTPVLVAKADNLALINQYNGTGAANRYFNFDTKDNVFNVTENSGQTYSGKLTINGKTDSTNTQRSTINGAGHDLFIMELTDETIVEVINTKITGANNVAKIHSGNKFIINNSEISGNSGEITNNGFVEFTGTSTLDNNIKGHNGDVKIVSGKTTFGSNSTVEQKTFSVASGAELVVNNKIETTQNFTNNGTINNNGNLFANGGFENTSTVINNGNFEVTNTGTVDDSKNNGVISGTGNLTVKSVLENNGTIAQDNITIDNGYIMTDVANLYTNNASDAIAINNNGELDYISGNGTLRDITGDATSNVRINTENDFVLNNNISGVQINLDDAVLKFGTGSIANAASLNLNGGSIYAMDGETNTYDLGNVNLNTNTKLAMDFNLENLTSDVFNANVTNNGGIFYVDKINIFGIPQKDNVRIHLGDTTTLGQENVTSVSRTLPELMTPIRKISGNLDKGWITYAPVGNSANDFNPSILASPVATVVGGYLTQAQTLHEGFFHMDRYMNYNKKIRMTAENINKNAYAQAPIYRTPEVPEANNDMWIKPYTAFESISLNGGVKVSNVTYGALYGGDTELKDLGHGYKGVVTAYIGYNGAHTTYSGISMNQEGGTLGVVGNLYKGNFFTGFNLSTGASAGQAHTMYGTDNFAMLTAGIANKTGYNIELNNGRFIIQPSLFTGYVFANTFDYTNSAGVRLNSDALHAIQIAPGIKFIGNTKNHWQPYIGIDMVWNIMGKTHFYASDTRLPQLSVRPYVQYGAGIQKTWKDQFSAYGQVMLRNGGRTGVSLNAGFCWRIGKINKKDKKTQTIQTPKKTLVKSLS